MFELRSEIKDGLVLKGLRPDFMRISAISSAFFLFADELHLGRDFSNIFTRFLVDIAAMVTTN